MEEVEKIVVAKKAEKANKVKKVAVKGSVLDELNAIEGVKTLVEGITKAVVDGILTPEHINAIFEGSKKKIAKREKEHLYKHIDEQLAKTQEKANALITDFNNWEGYEGSMSKRQLKKLQAIKD